MNITEEHAKEWDKNFKRVKAKDQLWLPKSTRDTSSTCQSYFQENRQMEIIGPLLENDSIVLKENIVLVLFFCLYQEE